MQQPSLIAAAALAAFALAADVRATIVDVDHADQVCPPTADPCVIDERVVAAQDAVLDFGTRTVELRDRGGIEARGFGLELRCGAFLGEDGASPAIVTRDAYVLLRAERSCSVGTDVRCIDDAGCDDGTCTSQVCADDPGRVCTDSADCDLGACSAHICTEDEDLVCADDSDCYVGDCDVFTARCMGDASILCIGDSDCQRGPCEVAVSRCATDTSVVCGADTDCDKGECSVDVCSVDISRPCAIDADCYDGTCSLGDGRVNLGGANLRAEFTGELEVIAADDVRLTKPIRASSRNGEDVGGFIELKSGAGSVFVGARIRARGGKFGTGGEIKLTAADDIVIDAPINIDGGEFDGGFFELDAGRDVLLRASVSLSSTSHSGFGGVSEVIAGRDIIVASRTRIEANGGSGSDGGGDGGEYLYSAQGRIVIEPRARITSRGGRPEGYGGYIEFESNGDTVVSGRLDASGRHQEGGGGVVSLSSSGALTLDAESRLEATGGNGIGAEVQLESISDLTAVGRIDTRTFAGGLGEFLTFESLTGTVTIGGRVSTGGAGVGPEAVELRVSGCDVVFPSDARVENDGVIDIAARELLTVEAGASIEANETDGVALRYRDAGTAPVVDGEVSPAPTLILDPSLPACP